ncbi:MAG TPA: M24 family metallopeptidase [Caulobacteraceae bacterium]|jgi:Xaa-Pro aminopeptidase|nr:M24 family metallopeptidase [Caulobacteraceae bacterium]
MTALADDDRRAALLQAQAKALSLFEAIEAGGLIAAGRTEREVGDAIYALAQERFGVAQHWHNRVVRAGPNTLTGFFDMPDDRTIAADDNVYIDLGPVFEDWEADIGRTYALGEDPERRRLVADLPRVFERVQAHYHATPAITGAELYAFAQAEAAAAGWLFGGVIAGHLVGEFPHRPWPIERKEVVIAPVNTEPMRKPDHLGRPRHWILEIHLVDQARTFGGFYEQLL